MEHLNLSDCLHFPVNHTENYVDPETGAHTQTVEGMCRQVKAFLPNFGLKPGDLTYFRTLWLRYTKQRKLDKFVHYLACVKEKRPFKQFRLPQAQMCTHAARKESNSGDNAIVVDLKDND